MPLPLIGQVSALLLYFLTFSFIVLVSKTYISSEGREEVFKENLKRKNLLSLITEYLPETLAVSVAQFVLTILALIVSLLIFLIGGGLSVIKPLISGGEVSWTGLLITLVLALSLYFSVVTSFPLFFGRAMLRGKGFGETLAKFLGALFVEVSWRMLLSWDYLKSSLVISLISLLLFLLGLFLFFVPPLASLLSFLTLHLLYTFGTVACFRLLRS